MQRAQQLEHYLEAAGTVELKDLAYTLNTDREETPYCLAIVSSTLEEFRQKLHYALQRLSNPQCKQIKDRKGIYFFEEPLSRNGKLAFLFPGEGAQYLNMLSDLCIHFPELRACFDEIDAAFIDHRRGFLPSHIIFPPPTFSKADHSQMEKKIWQMDGAIEAVFTANKALSTLLSHLSLKPDVIVGHSTGEFSAMCASGMTTINLSGIRTLNSIYERFVKEGDIPEAQMVAVGASYEVVSTLIDRIDGNIYVAMDNCPHQVIVVGEQSATDQAVDEFKRRGLIYENLSFNRAYHTPLFKNVCEHFRQFFSEQPVSPPTVETWSCSTAESYPQEIAKIHELVASQWMQPVEFRKTIEKMYATGARIFVEVGPRGNLTSFVDDILRKKPHLAVASNVPHRSGITQLNHLVGILAAQGISMRLDYLYSHRNPQRLSLENTPTTDTKDTDGSITLSLGFPSIHVSPRTKPIEKKETAQTNPKVTLTPQEASSSGQAHMAPQKSTEIFSPKSNQSWTGNPQSETLITEDEASRSPQAMEDYLRTMEHFLEVQQEVMKVYLSRRRGSSVNDRIDVEESLVSSPLPVESSQPQEAAHASVQSLTQTVLHLVSERTGYPEEMLDLNLDMEADLGIDSIKRIEILGAIQEDHASLHTEIDMEQVASLKTLKQVIDFLITQLKTSETIINMPASPTDKKLVSSANASAVPQGDAPSVDLEMEQGNKTFPFIGTTISHVPGHELVVHRQIDLKEYVFLNDHTLGGDISMTDDSLKPLCIIPMTVSMEMMAETAAKLLPDKLLVGMKNIRAHRWIPVEGKPTTIKINALRRTSVAQDEVQVKIWNIDDSAKPDSMKGYLAAEGTMVFSNAHPKPPQIKTFSLKSERPPKYTAEELYNENLMFHGPRFQGVVRLNRSGEDGILGELEVLPRTDLFQSSSNPTLITDPFLLDAAGQLVGYWPLEYLEVDFIAFPIRLKELHLYGPNPLPSERLRCHVRICQVTSTQIQADIDIIGPDDRILMRLIGWEDWRFHCTSELFNFWRYPKDQTLSVPWDSAISNLPVPESFECYKLNKLESDQLVLKDIWVSLILNQGERETWQHLKGPESHRTDWLFGRWVAKDAVRMFLKKHHGITLSPVDIEIATDEYGRPVPQGHWTQNIESAPAVSLSHADGVAVAVVGNCSNDHQIGIDIELINQHNSGFTKHAFVPEEQSLLYSLDEPIQQEWITRLWCAKEAVSKALGRGLMGNPKNLAVKEFNTTTGVVSLSLRGKMSETFTEFAHTSILAYTSREGDYVIASSLCERDSNESNK
jgi:phosphopantetheine--protein transferase-like protein